MSDSNENNSYEMVMCTDGSGLYQIRALRDLPDVGVKKGEWGGVVSSPNNLSNLGDAWIEKKSAVIGSAYLLSGYVGGKSLLDGKILVIDARITDSKIKGEVVLNGKIEILNSTIEDTIIEGKGYANIVDSTIKRLRSKIEKNEKMIFDKVHFISESNFHTRKTQVWSNNNIQVVGGKIEKELELRDSDLNMNLFHVFQKAELEYLSNTDTNLTFRIGDSDFLTAKKAIMKGWSKEQPIQIHSEVISVISSTVEGNITLSGTFKLEDSKVSDYAKIDFLGVLDSVTMSDFSSVYTEKDKREYQVLKYITLMDDNVYSP